MLTIHTTGRWQEGAVRSAWTTDSRPRIPEVEVEIARAWAEASARPGVLLFDGPMCRLERWDATPERLHLTLSPTTYKAFLGTNMVRPEFGDRHGPAALANPLGTCVALETADGRLVLGRRNASVAYYPDRVHPVAGSLEPSDDGDPFRTARRELSEEVSLAAEDVVDLTCLGLVEDHRLRQPELVFHARASRTLESIRGTLDRAEHDAIVGMVASADAIDAAIADPALTPVAVGSLLLWGRGAFGDEWFTSRRARLIGR